MDKIQFLKDIESLNNEIIEGKSTSDHMEKLQSTNKQEEIAKLPMGKSGALGNLP